MKKEVRVVIFAFILFIFLFMAVNLREFGEPDQKQREVDQYYIDKGRDETGAANAVTSVVFDYRGYDTLGEATVLFTAIGGIVVVLRRFGDDRGQRRK